ncbi:hypothetical protein CNR22_23350 [Sphingobacteriaceae bacterium]|nr:hypothetical protein CNR22_23350 [Sphingobacteriaceae bacterium]
MNYLTSIFAFVIAAGCLWMSVKMIRLYLQVKKWQRVQASLSSKELILHSRHSTSRAPYGIKAEYSYLVNDKIYHGDTVYLIELTGGQVNMMKSDAEQRLAKINDDLFIFVNPSKPQQSLVYCEGIGLYVFIFSMGVFACLMGLNALL